MDVEVNGPWMVRVFGHSALKLGHDLVCASLCLPTTVGPVIPGLGVHHCLGMEDSDLDVLRKALGDVPERVRPGLVQCRTVSPGVGRIPLGQSRNERLLFGARM